MLQLLNNVDGRALHSFAKRFLETENGMPHLNKTVLGFSNFLHSQAHFS